MGLLNRAIFLPLLLASCGEKAAEEPPVSKAFIEDCRAIVTAHNAEIEKKFATANQPLQDPKELLEEIKKKRRDAQKMVFEPNPNPYEDAAKQVADAAKRKIESDCRDQGYIR